MFYGIIIRMYYDEGTRHNSPHLHAYYNETEAVFEIDTGNVIGGKFPPKETRLVQAWIDLRKSELLANWKLAREGEALYKVEPLR